MSGVFRTLRNEDPPRGRGGRQDEGAVEPILDTLAAILRSYGREAFDVQGATATEIAARCEQWAGHVLTGAPLPGTERRILPLRDRSWAGVRRFFADLRGQETRHVRGSIETMRSVLWSFAGILRRSIDEDRHADADLRREVETLREALGDGSLDRIRDAAERVSGVVDIALSRRRQRQDAAMRALGQRLSEVREELKEAHHSAETDSMTGLPNRAAFDQRAESTVTLCAYGGQPTCLLLLDLDRFKLVNDEHGHRAGDAVLAACGALLAKQVFRRSDFVGRFGGEEFVAILDDSSEDDGLRAARRLLAAFRSMEVRFEGKTLRVTASIGVAGLRPGDDEGSWIEAADQALYRAKRDGRDRVEVREPAADPVDPVRP